MYRYESTPARRHCCGEGGFCVAARMTAAECSHWLPPSAYVQLPRPFWRTVPHGGRLRPKAG
jgi:hypothetical protein